MLTVFRTIIGIIGLCEVVLLFLSITFFPGNRVIQYLRKHEKLQIAFAFILLICVAESILSR